MLSKLSNSAAVGLEESQQPSMGGADKGRWAVRGMVDDSCRVKGVDNKWAHQFSKIFAAPLWSQVAFGLVFSPQSLGSVG